MDSSNTRRRPLFTSEELQALFTEAAQPNENGRPQLFKFALPSDFLHQGREEMACIESIFLLAVLHGKKNLVRAILDRADAEMINEIFESITPDLELSPIMYAVDSGSFDIVEILLSYPHSREIINDTATTGFTALMVAAQKNLHEIARILIDAGADITLTDNLGHNALCYAVGHGAMETFSLLTAKYGQFQIENVLRQRDRENNTLLAIAAMNGHTEMLNVLMLFLEEDGVALLQSAGAGDALMTPLMLASNRGHSGTVLAILKHLKEEATAALEDNANLLGCTALSLAIFGEQLDTVKTLIQAGSNIEARNNVNSTPLIMAAVSNMNILEALLDAGANVNAVNNAGFTALMVASNAAAEPIENIQRRFALAGVDSPEVPLQASLTFRNLTYRLLSAMTSQHLQSQPTPQLTDDARCCAQEVNEIRYNMFQTLWPLRRRSQKTSLPEDLSKKIVSEFLTYPVWYRHRLNRDLKEVSYRVGQKIAEKEAAKKTSVEQGSSKKAKYS